MRPNGSEQEEAAKPDWDLLDARGVGEIFVFEYTLPAEQSRGITFRFLALVLWITRRKRFLFGLFILALLAGAFYFHKAGHIGPEQIVGFLRSYPALAPIVFMLIYAVMVAVLLPTMPLNLAAGFLWGAYVGTAYTVIGATGGAAVAFIVSRYLFHERVSRILQGRAWRWLDDGITHKGWRIVAFTRVNPIFPFGMVNWFFGISSISFGDYLWATVVFIIPPALFISAIGSSVGSFVLTGEKEAILLNVLLASAAFTVLVIGGPLIARYLLRKDGGIPRN